MTKAETDTLLQEARDRWNACDEAEQGQRDRILLAKKFRTGDQWPSALKLQRAGASSAKQGSPPLPERPCLVIDRLSQPCRQVSNSIKTANFAIDVLPTGFGADTETAKIFRGYLRYVQNQARGESPIEWAADQAIEGGIGWFRIQTEYCYQNTDGVPPEAIGDQTLSLGRIANNLAVYCDPWAVKPTKRDMRFLFMTEDLAREEFERRWPDADLRGLEELAATGNAPKGWIGNDSIRIAEYWRVTYREEVWTEQRRDQWVRVREAPKTNGNGLRTRVIQRPVVGGFKITASEILEQWDWIGSAIPFVPILGEEYNVEGKQFVRGLIEPGMDPQRMVNYTYSGAVEIFALGSKAQYVAADDQIAEYKKIWETANIFNYSYLPYKPVVVQGNLLPQPQRDVSEAPIQAAALLLQVSEEGIKATTGIYDPSLGNINPQMTSGRMVSQLQGQTDLGSSNYPDNVKRALIYAGELMVEIAPKITRVGQLLHIIGEDDIPEEVIIGQPFQQQNNRAVPVDPRVAELQQGVVKFYDLTKGKYGVAVAVGKSFTTKREEGVAMLGQLIPGLPPEMAMIAAPELVENLSFQGAHQMAEKMRRVLPPQLQDQSPEQQQNLVMQLQQAQAMIQQLQPLANRNQVDLQRAQIAAQAQLQRGQSSDAASLQRTEITAAASMANAQAKVDAENFRSFAEALEASLSRKLDLHMQAISAALEHSHEANIARQQQAHDLQQMALEHAQTLEQQHQQGQIDQQVAAAQPAPQGPPQ